MLAQIGDQNRTRRKVFADRCALAILQPLQGHFVPASVGQPAAKVGLKIISNRSRIVLIYRIFYNPQPQLHRLCPVRRALSRILWQSAIRNAARPADSGSSQRRF
jgi:hypothetical protein